jgi:sec-independent protein translocase protein TatA
MIYPLANLFGEYNWLLLGALALLFFGGKRLPEMGRSLGRGIVEFKKGLHGIGEEIDEAASAGSSRPQGTVVPRLPAEPAPKAALEAGYKFDPYTGKPLVTEAPPPMRFDPYTGKPLNQETANSGASNNIGA